MRRTYRSKRDAGGALDHKDVLLAVDEKTSAFDAFYIESLKQTKRELSCMGTSSQYKAVPHKVRKKKFVKRIVKDVEHNPPETNSRSTYLTPDKSIRLNKGLDLFDQLLNSSSKHVDPKVIKEDGLVDKVWSTRPAKTYSTRKARKAKKYNYSSSESYESDKENEVSNVSQNASDIRAHKLTVEKDVSSPKHQDESINNIVQNLSLLNNMKNMDNSNSPVISFNCGKKRTKQLQSIAMNKSVLSSTPFKNIRTATSIYKFSPISRMSYGDRSNYVTIVEECDSQLPTNSLKSSPVTHFKETQVGNGRPKVKCHRTLASAMNEDILYNSVIENHTSKEAVRTSMVNNGETTETVRSEDQKEVNDLDCVSVLNDTSNASFLKVSLGGSKPSEVFLGFTVVDSENDMSNGDNPQEKDIIDAEKKEINNVSIDPDVREIGSDSELALLLRGSKLSEPFFEINATENEMNFSVASQMSEEIDNMNTSQSETFGDSQDLESLYDTCNSEKCAEISNLVNEQPVVKIERMEDAIFREYYEKMAAYASDPSGDEDMDEDSGDNDSEENEAPKKKSTAPQADSDSDEMVDKFDVDSDDYSNPNQNSGSASNDSNIESDRETVSPLENESDSGSMSDDDLEIDSNDDEEVRCFVNTRRRVKIKQNSNKLSLENSSSASSECNKTVLSNNKIIMNSSRVNEIQNEILVSDEDPNTIRDSVDTNVKTSNFDIESITLDSDEAESKAIDERGSSITGRMSSRNSLLQKSAKSSMEVKPAIVLQPGKKWQRSLSIYRRMTMMNDHFDRSVLEDEPMNCKGRKYRHSVISVMEMQEGSLHNESISSRRSTFVAKPCRSTIRFLKEPNSSRISLCNNTVYEDLIGFLSNDCDDTIVELSKLSISDSGHDITVVDKLHDRFTTARDYVLRRCNQTEPILFDECYPDTVLKNCHKIGEGVFGEVFLWRARDGRARVMKIVPIAGTTKINGEHQKDFHEVISEIVIAMELSALRTPIADLERQFDEGKDVDALELHAIQNATDVFNEVLAVRCVYGNYTSRLLDLWELYDECKGSDNDNPAILPSDQQYIVLELANAGQDLEGYQFNSAAQTHALFLQVAFALAVGEEAFQFEHRDLHWGNVLIAPTEEKLATFVIRGRCHRVPRRGVAATIIDYTLSRLSLPLSPAGESAALYYDLAGDHTLFESVGDYQFEVYRLMRDKLQNDWQNFEPYTNILWLHYVVDKMITTVRYKRTNTKIHKHYISKLKAIKDRILSYGSTVQFVLTDIGIINEQM